jgi:hypothetical protein
MHKQPDESFRPLPACRTMSTWPMLLAGLCAVLMFCAPSVHAQASFNQARANLTYRHFSSATAMFTAPHLIASAKSASNTDVVPIPGGIDIPPLIHIFAPGPPELGFQGLDVEPNGITNFNGFAALGYLGGTATDSNNNSYTVSTDMRLFQGEYVSADGTHHRGTFVFI